MKRARRGNGLLIDGMSWDDATRIECIEYRRSQLLSQETSLGLDNCYTTSKWIFGCLVPVILISVFNDTLSTNI